MDASSLGQGKIVDDFACKTPSAETFDAEAAEAAHASLSTQLAQLAQLNKDCPEMVARLANHIGQLQQEYTEAVSAGNFKAFEFTFRCVKSDADQMIQAVGLVKDAELAIEAAISEPLNVEAKQNAKTAANALIRVDANIRQTIANIGLNPRAIDAIQRLKAPKK
jgi:hypothetical protein